MIGYCIGSLGAFISGFCLCYSLNAEDIEGKYEDKFFQCIEYYEGKLNEHQD